MDELHLFFYRAEEHVTQKKKKSAGKKIISCGMLVYVRDAMTQSVTDFVSKRDIEIIEDDLFIFIKQRRAARCSGTNRRIDLFCLRLGRMIRIYFETAEATSDIFTRCK